MEKNVYNSTTRLSNLYNTPTLTRRLHGDYTVQSRPINRYTINRYAFLVIFDHFPKKSPIHIGPIPR